MSTKTCSGLVTFIVAIALFSAVSQANSETLLRWKLHEGQIIELEIRSKTITTAAGEVSHTENDAFFSAVTVDDVQGNEFFLSTTVERVGLGRGVPGTTEIYVDSQSDLLGADLPAPESGEFWNRFGDLKKVVGNKTTLRLNDRGEISHHSAASNVSESFSPLYDAYLALFWLTLPKNTPTIGDSWPRFASKSGRGHLSNTTAQYTYDGVESRLHRFSFIVTKNENSEPPPNVQIGDLTGVVYFDDVGGLFQQGAFQHSVSFTEDGLQLSIETTGELKLRVVN